MTDSARARVIAALEQVDPDLGAFITVDPDAALRRAAREPGGRLRGLVLAVKDLVDTAGLRTTYGSPRYRYHVPTLTAPVVARLEKEGAIVVGKTNLNEFAYGVSGYNPHYGLMRVPGDRDRTPGGSSGGSAVAVAAGMCDVAVGTDTAGSVRIPAACCGVFGFKCAHGAVPMTGVHPLAPQHDSIGYLARSVDVLQRVLDIPELPPTRNVRVATADDVRLPPFPADDHWTVFREQSYRLHHERATRHPGEYGDDLHVKLSQPVGDVAMARAVLHRWRIDFVRSLAGFHLLVLPVFPGDAPTVEEVLRDYRDRTLHTSDRLLSITPIVNALGWPALAVPTSDGPRQVIGPPGTEASILAVGDRLSRG
ncbi:amidase [Micromonospora andamanensis]|uniref:Amidase n=1 Tax=Micromonospora andamanensis TaxID=1287068 RepID=A0ABQ4I3R5_9ACTN|nr:amidase [Micromonospora andamanensis]GIJ12510.1 amidase [Micromonospora andamanensis]GIJ42005.1 amidase [Micromonospora andamanensis]